MRGPRFRGSRSRSPRMRVRAREFSPRVRDRQYSPRTRDRQNSPRPQGRKYSPRIRDRQYSPQIRGRQHSPQIRGRQHSPQIRGRQYSPQIRDRQYSPQIRDRQYSPRFRARQNSPQIRGYQDSPRTWNPKGSPRIRDGQYPLKGGEYLQQTRDRECSPRFRGGEHSPPRRDVGEQSLRLGSDFGRGAPSYEVERGRRVLDGEQMAGRRDYEGNVGRDREGHLRKLSQLHEALPQDSPSVKFQWRHSMAEPVNSNIASSNVKPMNYYGLASSRMTSERGYSGGSGFSNTGQNGVLPEKPLPMGQDRGTSFSAFRADAGFPKTTNLESSFPLPSDGINDSRRYRKDAHLHFGDSSVRAERPRESLVEEDKPYLYSRDSSQYLMSNSHSKTVPAVSSGMDSYHGSSYIDSLNLPSSGFRRSSAMPTNLVGNDGYGETSYYKPAANSEVQPKDVMNYREVGLSFTEGKGKEHIYPEPIRNEKSKFHTMPDENYDNMTTVREGYRIRDSFKAGKADPDMSRSNASESSRGAHLRESMQWDQHNSFEGPLNPAHLDSRRASLANIREDEILVPRASYPEFQAEGYRNYDRLNHGNDYTFERDTEAWEYEEQIRASPMLDCDQGPYGADCSFQRRVSDGGLDMHNEKIVKRRALVDRRISKHKYGSKLLGNKKFPGKIPIIYKRENRQTSRDVASILSKKSAFSRLRFKKTDRDIDETAHSGISELDNWLPSQNVSVSKWKQISRAQKNASRDLKNNGRPVPWSIQAQQSSVTKIHKRTIRKSADDSHAHIELSPEATESIPNTEPPEGSEDFKQLVQSAFLKFVKQLNENPAQRRKYMKKERARMLKCSICGSSEEFVDAQGLAMHAFASTTTGFKAQHLGFHKALCLLMGWNSVVWPKSPWVCEALPEAEALALKEDLIIWPPLIILHNSSIENNDPALRMIITNEALKTYLTDKGFGGGHAKVCRGTPANQSIMVVSFTGTLSGLQEAERLHEYYANNKHGRADFRNRSEGTEEMVADKVGHALYGYLGLAGDFDKLDPESKRRCVVKSKKDIQAIADAPVTTE